MSGIFSAYIKTEDNTYFDLTGLLSSPSVTFLDCKITGDLSNDIVAFEIPATTPPTSIISSSSNMTSSGYGGCFSQNLKICKDSIKVEGIVRSFAEIWYLYYYFKWDDNLKTLYLGDSSDGGLKQFKVQFSNFNWFIIPGHGRDFSATLQLKVVDDE